MCHALSTLRATEKRCNSSGSSGYSAAPNLGGGMAASPSFSSLQGVRSRFQALVGGGGGSGSGGTFAAHRKRAVSSDVLKRKDTVQRKGKFFFFLFLSFENVKKERGFLAWPSMRKDWRLEGRKKISGLPQLFFRFVGLILKNLKFFLFFFLTPFLLSLPCSVKGPFKRAQKAFQSREGRERKKGLFVIWRAHLGFCERHRF